MSGELGAKVEVVFSGLLADAGLADLGVLRAEVREHLTGIEMMAKTNGLLPVDIAQELAAGLEVFLDLYNQLTQEHQGLVVAAARYFVSEEDAVPDTEGVLGLDDDIEVFNYVADKIGHSARKIQL